MSPFLATKREALRRRILECASLANTLDGEHTDSLIASIADAMADLGFSANTGLQSVPAAFGGGAWSAAARWFLASISGEKDVDQCINRLERLAETNRVEMVHVVALWGLHPSQAVALGSNLELMALSHLPPSDPQAFLLAEHTTSFPSLGVPKPRAALVRRFVHRPVFVETIPNVAPPWTEAHLLSDLALVLTLLSESPVLRTAEWYQVEPSVPILGMGFGWAGDFRSRAITKEIEPTSIDAESARGLARGFLQFEPNARRRAVIALRRLNESKLRQSLADVGLELGIALEALLTDSEEGNEGISHRLRLRTALLLGGTLEERMQVSRKVDALYGLRSAAAHGAELDMARLSHARVKVAGRKRTAEELREIAEDGRTLVEDLARRLISLGYFPNWRSVELSGDFASSDGNLS